MGIEYFDHEHPWIFKEELKNDGEESGSNLENFPSCGVCGKNIMSGPSYGCEECDLFIHKSCSELSPEIQHPLHPDHPLFLSNLTSCNYGSCYCDACKRESKNLFYHCSTCSFDLDLVCASITDRTVVHPSHKHPLQILQRQNLCVCDACGSKHEGVFYACITCDQYWIHQDCASLPAMFENTSYHDHPLTLAYSLPSQYATFVNFCQICDKQIFSWLWLYYCSKCRFLVHVDCVTSSTEHFMSVMLPKKEFYSSRRKNKIPVAAEDFHLDAVHMPLQDEFLSLVDHFQKDIQLRTKENTISQPIYCHGRLLALYDAVQDNNDTRLDIINDHVIYQKTLCNACIMPISTPPFYKCVVNECNFIVHKSCAELPDEIWHPFHSEHVLILCLSPSLGSFTCEGCKLLCNGFRYSCADCDYHLDVICASLPKTIKHEAHVDHPMSLKKKISRHCYACYNSWIESSFAFGCGSCDFELHSYCATYPSTVRHRYDETHPYTLTYRPVEDHESDYLCDICENELNPLWWFYHCIDCDKSMHTFCHPTFSWRSKIKYGGVLTISSHPHPLHTVPVININTQCNGYVKVVTEGTLCSKCGEDFCNRDFYCPLGFKCLECKFWIHYFPCLFDLEKEGIDIIVINEY